MYGRDEFLFAGICGLVGFATGAISLFTHSIPLGAVAAVAALYMVVSALAGWHERRVAIQRDFKTGRCA